MTRWHPVIADIDPTDAWFSESQLSEMRRDEQMQRAIGHRVRFEAAVARLVNPTPQEIKRLWHQLQEDDK